MSLDIAQLAKDMSAAFVGSLKGSVPDIESYADGEAQKFAHSLAMIEQLLLNGTIDQDEAALHLQIQKNASRTVFLTINGLGILAVEAAINAALAVVQSTVNTALGFALI